MTEEPTRGPGRKRRRLFTKADLDSYIERAHSGGNARMSGLILWAPASWYQSAPLFGSASGKATASFQKGINEL